MVDNHLQELVVGQIICCKRQKVYIVMITQLLQSQKTRSRLGIFAITLLQPTISPLPGFRRIPKYPRRSPSQTPTVYRMEISPPTNLPTGKPMAFLCLLFWGWIFPAQPCGRRLGTYRITTPDWSPLKAHLMTIPSTDFLLLSLFKVRGFPFSHLTPVFFLILSFD